MIANQHYTQIFHSPFEHVLPLHFSVAHFSPKKLSLSKFHLKSQQTVRVCLAPHCTIKAWPAKKSERFLACVILFSTEKSLEKQLNCIDF